MSQTDAETTTAERKPPTLADIVREKTDDGARIIDFFLDVMEGRVDGAELCHRIDAGKQLVKYGSREAAEFIAKHKGVACGHSARGRLDPADPCYTEDRSLVAVTLNAPPTLTREFLTVLSGIDEFLMARLIRAQTADGGTIIDFLYDVMQDTTEGFRIHHRIAAAKELIVHIARDEHPAPTPPVVPAKAGTHPSDPALSSAQETAHNLTVVPAQAERNPHNPTVVPVETGTHPSDPALSSVQGPAHNPSVVPAQAKGNPDNPTVVPAQAEGNPHNPTVVPVETGTHPSDPALSSAKEPAHNPTVVPAEAGTHPSDPALSSAKEPAHTPTLVPTQPEGNPDNPTVVPAETGTHPSDPALSSVQEPAHNQTVVHNSKPRTLPRRRRTRTQRRRDGNARAAALDKASQRNKEEKPAPAELTPAEHRIREKLVQHWREPDPWTGPIDSTTSGRSPPS